jgi:hypothetical protein
MFKDPAIALFSIIGLCIPLFGFIIYYGLKNRQQTNDQGLAETNANVALASISLQQGSIKHLLYGNFYDTSNTVVTLSIRDIHNHNVAHADFSPHVTITCQDTKFGVFNETQAEFKITVRPLLGQSTLANPIAECTHQGLFSTHYRYQLVHSGVIDVTFKRFGKQATVTQNGVIVGQLVRLGPYELSGKAIALTIDMPLIEQVVLLCGPFRNRRSMPF